MAKTQRPKTLAEQIADLDDPTPRDFDPEDHGATHTNGVLADSDSDAAAGTDDDGEGGREHYVDVGNSTLRGPEEVVLGARYEGTSVPRDALMGVGMEVDQESDDDPFGSGASARGGGSEEDEEEEGDEGEEEKGGIDVDGEMGGVEGEKDQDEDEDIDSDEAFGEGDGERFKGFTFRGSKGLKDGKDVVEDSMDLVIGGSESEGDSLLGGSESGASDSDELDASSEKDDMGDDDNSSHEDGIEVMEDDDDENEDEVEDEDEDKGPLKATDERTELRKMMAEEQKTVASTISQAAKADVEKGNAVRHQRSTFDSLLNTRIRLQKALIATNSIPTLKDHPTGPTDPDARQAILAAEEAAINLWSQLDTLRHTLPSATQPGTKRKRSLDPDPDSHPNPSTPTTTLWHRMQSHESTAFPTRRSTLEKWSARLRPVSAFSSSRNLLTATPTTQPLTSVLDHHLADMSRLVARTQTPRSCAPLQAQAGVGEARNVYDDADFYTLLLRELVDQRMADSVATAGVSAVTTGAGAGAGAAGGIGGGVGTLPRREGRVRKKVDTKASKGRKMRYTVHEKLQNFMASEDRGTWGDRQRDELFGGLLGRRAGLMEDEEVDGEDEGDGEEEGLRLFRSREDGR